MNTKFKYFNISEHPLNKERQRDGHPNNFDLGKLKGKSWEVWSIWPFITGSVGRIRTFEPFFA